MALHAFYPLVVLLEIIVVMIFPPVLSCPGIATNEVHIDCDEEIKIVNSRSKSTTPIVEYFKEHEVSERESKMALDALDLDQVSQVPAWCNECGMDEIYFCRSTAFINDHCCCEHRHARGEFSETGHNGANDVLTYFLEPNNKGYSFDDETGGTTDYFYVLNHDSY